LELEGQRDILSDPPRSSEELTKDFYSELEKAQLMVDIQEKYLNRYFEMKKTNQVADVQAFIQEVISERQTRLE
jgi:hypothetical protein